MKQIITLGLVFLVSGAGAAWPYDLAYQDCMKASRGVTIDMLDCIAGGIERAETAIESLLAEKMPDLDPSKRKALNLSQDQWSDYRQSTCRAQASLWGDGNFRSVVLAGCRLTIAEERLKWLQAVLPQ